MTVATAIQPLQATELAGNMANHDVSMWGLFLQADILVKLVMLMLFSASIWCWTIIFNKYTRFKIMKHQTTKFEESFWSGDMLENLYEKIKQTADHPIALAVDGGVTPATAPAILAAGADTLIAGTSVFRAPDYAKAITELRGGA